MKPRNAHFLLFDNMHIFRVLVKKSNVLRIHWPKCAKYYQIPYHRNCFYEYKTLCWLYLNHSHKPVCRYSLVLHVEKICFAHILGPYFGHFSSDDRQCSTFWQEKTPKM